eukprot:scaffold5087_cov125-Isochrysis_galbana.AAC.4
MGWPCGAAGRRLPQVLLLDRFHPAAALLRTTSAEAREQDAPGTHDAKHRAPVHGHTGGVPSDKALSDTAPAPHPVQTLCSPVASFILIFNYSQTGTDKDRQTDG